MIEYKAEIWNSNTLRHDVIEGSNLTGLYAYLLQNIELTLNKPTASVDDISDLLTALASSVADSDTYYDDMLDQAQDELRLSLNSYEHYYYDDENKQMLNQVVLKQLKETASLLTPEALDIVFRDLSVYCKEHVDNYFKYQNMGNRIKTLYTVKVNDQGKTSTDIQDCYNYLIDHLDQLDHSSLTHSVYDLLAAIDDYLSDHISCNTEFVSTTRMKITNLLACHKANGTTLINHNVKRHLKQLGSSFSDAALELILVNFNKNTINGFYYHTSFYVESDKRWYRQRLSIMYY